MCMQADIDFGAGSFQTMLSAGCRSGRQDVAAVEGLERHCNLLVSCSYADHRTVMAGAVHQKLGRRREHKAGDHPNCTSGMDYYVSACYTGIESAGIVRGRRKLALQAEREVVADVGILPEAHHKQNCDEQGDCDCPRLRLGRAVSQGCLFLHMYSALLSSPPPGCAFDHCRGRVRRRLHRSSVFVDLADQGKLAATHMR